jgi:hypothetical protein
MWSASTTAPTSTTPRTLRRTGDQKLDPDTTRNYQYVRVKVRFTAKITHPYHLKQGANLLDCVLIRRNSAQPWRITSDSPVDS